MCVGFQPFQAHLASTTDPDKKQMLEKLDAAVTAALQPLQAAMERQEEAVQPLAEVRLNPQRLMFNWSSTVKYESLKRQRKNTLINREKMVYLILNVITVAISM